MLERPPVAAEMLRRPRQRSRDARTSSTVTITYLATRPAVLVNTYAGCRPRRCCWCWSRGDVGPVKSAGLAASQSVHRDQAPQGEEPILGGGPVGDELRHLVRGPHRGRGLFARTPARTAAFRPARTVACRRARDAGDNRRPVSAGLAPRSSSIACTCRWVRSAKGTRPRYGTRYRRTCEAYDRHVEGRQR